MKTVRDVMTQDIITIHPSSTVKTAIILMKGHEIGALPVVNGEALLGLVECQDVLGHDGAERVSDLMNRDFTSVEPDLAINKAAGTMGKMGTTRLLVEEQGSLVGIITHSDVLPELGKSFDPLTGLPWSDTLREWAAEKFEQGREISILFFDIDNFGAFNKKYGHIIGDAVIKTICSLFETLEDPSTDCLCRMGGDEFVIGSIRPRDEALELATRAQEAVTRLEMEGIEEALRVSFGVSGGRRTKEREITHFAATIDDLLNRASQECTHMKVEKRRKSETAKVLPGTPLAPAGTRLHLEKIGYASTDTKAEVEVRLLLGSQVFENSTGGHSSIRSTARIVAEACAGAAEQALPGDFKLAVEDVTEFRLPDSTSVLITTVLLASPRDVTPYYGLAVVRRGDLYRAAASSVLAAINRPFARLAVYPEG